LGCSRCNYNVNLVKGVKRKRFPGEYMDGGTFQSRGVEEKYLITERGIKRRRRLSYKKNQ